MSSNNGKQQKGKGKEADVKSDNSKSTKSSKSPEADPHEHDSDCDEDCGGALGEAWHKKSGEKTTSRHPHRKSKS